MGASVRDVFEGRTLAVGRNISEQMAVKEMAETLQRVFRVVQGMPENEDAILVDKRPAVLS